MVIDQRYIKKYTGLKVLSVRSCKSTFAEIGKNDVIIAQSQTYGEGRGDHKFFSPPGGIYIVMREVGLNINAHTLTPAVGLAAHDAIKSVTNIDTALKWVNDIMYNGKKAGGILVKCPRRGEYLIGIGVNYATDQKDLELAGITDGITLRANECRATEFCAELIKRIHTATLVGFDHKRYNALCETVGKTVSFMRGDVRVQGYAESVENDGSLIVRIGMATVAVDAGEVSLIREAKTEQP